MLKHSQINRFLKTITKTESCWNWDGALTDRGYGVFYANNKSIRAHRVSYWIRHGSIPSGFELLHSCDNRRCVNPDHLRPGSHLENMREMVARKRRPDTNGDRNPCAKLSEELVRRIRKMSGVTISELSRRYSVSRASIRNSINGKTWSCVGA